MNADDWLSGFGHRSRRGNRARVRRRRGGPAAIAAEVAPLEARVLMSRKGLAAEPPIAMPTQGLAPNAGAVMYQSPVKKEVTITNNTDSTVYPIVEGENSNSLYDPNDPLNQEYRVYAGYTVNGVDYFGLQPHKSVTVSIPMAIWDSGRMSVVTDTATTYQNFLQSSNPFFYDPAALKYVQPAVKGGVELLYHAKTPIQLAADAPAQFIEWGIRDPSQPTKEPVSFDYDLSYLDSMYLPMAVEAVPPKGHAPVGYVGTTNTLTNFSATVRKFADGSLLDGYFGGQGWPQYFLSSPSNPANPNDPLKIPGGNNLFQQSVSASSYDPNAPMLTSSQQTGVLPGNGGNYAANAITNLFFSWAKFYEEHNPGATPTQNLATLFNEPNVQTFAIKTSGPQDLKRAEAFSATVWSVMNAFSQDPLLNLSPRYVSGAGTTTAGSETLSGLPASVVAQLRVGMPVISGGSDLQPRTVVYQILSPTSIQLSIPATPSAGSNTYSFYFTGQASDPPPEAATTQLLHSILGDTVSEIPNPPIPPQEITDQVIALMRGVPDISNKYPESEWYPHPGDPTTSGDAKYNLNPFVWLVHTGTNWPPSNERIFAYAYSVDDQYGNVLIPGSSNLLVTVGGPNGLADTSPYQPPA